MENNFWWWKGAVSDIFGFASLPPQKHFEMPTLYMTRSRLCLIMSLCFLCIVKF
jgi:hypothetical protein